MGIEKMSDEEFISEIRATGLYDSAEEELRKRLSKNNIEEFKKRLIDEMYQEVIENPYNAKQIIENLINNLK